MFRGGFFISTLMEKQSETRGEGRGRKGGVRAGAEEDLELEREVEALVRLEGGDSDVAEWGYGPDAEEIDWEVGGEREGEVAEGGDLDGLEGEDEGAVNGGELDAVGGEGEAVSGSGRQVPPDLRGVVRDFPHKPGVYVMRDRFRRVIYVGKARDLKRRASQYFHPARRSRADLKTRALLDSVWSIDCHVVGSEAESLILEAKLIKFRPRYNIAFRDDKRHLLVKVNFNESWPRFRLARQRVNDGAQYFGPFVHAGPLRETLKLLRKRFGILLTGHGKPSDRDMKAVAYQVPQKLSEISHEQYVERVRNAAAFLGGDCKEFIEELKERMAAAAAALDFEKAASLRDMVADLKRTVQPVSRFTRFSLPTTVDPSADLRELGEVLGLGRPPVLMECFDISNVSDTFIVAAKVCFREGRPSKLDYRHYEIRSVVGQNDFASMAEVIRRRYSRFGLGVEGAETLMVAEDAVDYGYGQEVGVDALRRAGVDFPDLIIVDGGKGQLGAACRELQTLGLGDAQIIGLAKQYEEIHRPGGGEPLRLPADSGALKMLQRIRDEAHRFANVYQRRKMRGRVKASVLDGCRWVTPDRKRALLRVFGTVAGLQRASVDQLAGVEGMTPAIARRVWEFLQTLVVAED
jgi:excinuclease ABC subunit C